MENSRHERAIVVVASYVIGFTSAFIAFSTTQTTVPGVTVTTFDYRPAVAVSKPSRAYTASISIESDGLVAITESGRRLLSARKASPFLASVVSAEAQPGLAERIIEAELSRNSQFVYFCEQRAAEEEVCHAYVYNVSEDMLHPIKVNGEVYQPTITEHLSSWSPDGRLIVGEYSSVSAETPWLLQ